MTDSVPYEDLDPGIRRLVRLLNDNGFRTCDSGDGRSKFDAEGKPLPAWRSEDERFEMVMPIPHVAMACSPADLVTECDRLQAVLEAAGITVHPMDGEDEHVSVQGSYEPLAGCYLMVMGADDSMLL